MQQKPSVSNFLSPTNVSGILPEKLHLWFRDTTEWSIISYYLTTNNSNTNNLNIIPAIQ